jgi:hypothetical protein
MKFKIGFFLILFALPFSGKAQKAADLALQFQESLSKNLTEKVGYSFSDESRQNWHFFPDNMVDRSGVSLKNLNESQKDKLTELLAVFLSESGLSKTQEIMGLESVLFEIEKNKIRDPELYYVAFFGKPGSDKWAWKFEGHHLSLNFTVINGKVAAAPRFMGANPAKVLSGPKKGFRALGVEEDLAFDLLNSFNENELRAAIISEKTYGEIVTFNKSSVNPFQKSGLLYSSMNDDCRMKISKLIQTYLENLPQDQAKARWNSIDKSELRNVTFSWAGSKVRGSAYYYRIQGKTFLIEFDNSQNAAAHIHAVWRDFDNDFGKDLIREHYKKSEH